MPEGRPAIPEEIKRQVLAEAGHRCAVCGLTGPLELAHIEPWHKTRNHESNNLISLCSNCHSLADKEEWGKKTLAAYKQIPWVLRQNNAQSSAEAGPTVDLDIHIRIEFSEFNDMRERLLKYSLAGFLEISPERVEILSKREGSTVVTLRLPVKSAEQLLELYESSESLDLSPAIPVKRVWSREQQINFAVRQMQKGDNLAESFGVIFQEFRYSITRFFHKSGFDDTDTRDLTQEVFLLAFKRISTFSFESEFITWLYAIARNVKKRHLAHMKAGQAYLIKPDEPSASLEDHSLSSGGDSGPEIRRQLILDAIGELSHEQQRYLIFHLNEALSQDVSSSDHQKIQRYLEVLLSNEITNDLEDQEFLDSFE